MIKKRIIPAIIAKSQEEFEEKINRVKDFVKIIQLDFMDGVFVENKSIDFDFKIPLTNCNFEAHLMINNPMDWIEKNYSKVDTILVHFESCSNHSEIISIIKRKNKRVGFVLNPETSVDSLTGFLDDLDQVLIMTVHPGFYGSPFLPDMLDKISKLRTLKPDLDIEVDGGITDKTINLTDRAGANLFVSGSFIIKAQNIKSAVESLEKIVIA
jgi:ribulose-phosphate 3-epimerase